MNPEINAIDTKIELRVDELSAELDALAAEGERHRNEIERLFNMIAHQSDERRREQQLREEQVRIAFETRHEDFERAYWSTSNSSKPTLAG